MSDPAILEAAERALRKLETELIWWDSESELRQFATTFLAAVEPLIRAADAKLIEENVADLVAMTRAAALEEAAVVAEDVDRDVAAQDSTAWSVGYFAQHIRGTAAAIRALKEQP